MGALAEGVGTDTGIDIKILFAPNSNVNFLNHVLKIY